MPLSFSEAFFIKTLLRLFHALFWENQITALNDSMGHDITLRR